MDIREIYDLFIQYPNVITDSRKARSGSVFFALKGTNFDGNEFAAQALQYGCNYAVVDRPGLTGDRYIPVGDVLQTLQDLAYWHRKTLNIPVLAITGSNGKTTTKELIKSVLAGKFKVHATEGNLNNHIGVPLTLLGIRPDTELAIIEMGANHPGEIEALCRMAIPTHGLITNIGKAHLEGFVSIQGVKKAKKELYDFLDHSHGVVFFNEDNPDLNGMSLQLKTTKVAYGKPGVSFVWGEIIDVSPYLKVIIHAAVRNAIVKTHLTGTYNLENLLAATCIGLYFNISLKSVISSLESYEPDNKRSQVYNTDHNTLLLDFYNANPTSMNGSLDNFFTHIKGSKMVILGDMFELGDVAETEHMAIVEQLTGHPEILSVVVGSFFYKVASDNKKIFAFRDITELKHWLKTNPPADKVILLKGSRGMHLEQLIGLL